MPIFNGLDGFFNGRAPFDPKLASVGRLMSSPRGGGGSGTIGGFAIGAPLTGTFYTGLGNFIVGGGSDFDGPLDIISPANPRGKGTTTKPYSTGSRGSDHLSPMYDLDPYHTGWFDANMGEGIGGDSMTQSGSALILHSRRGTSQERAIFQGSGRLEVGVAWTSMFSDTFWPGDKGSGDILLEGYLTWSTGGPQGWHPTFWTDTIMANDSAQDSDQINLEGNSNFSYFILNIVTGGSNSGHHTGARINVRDGNPHKITMVMNKTQGDLYVDEVFVQTLAFDTNPHDKLQFALLTSHVSPDTFTTDDAGGAEAYSAADWASKTGGATFTAGWWRIAYQAGKTRYVPLASQADVNIAFGGSTTITLPSKAALWGDGSVTEDVVCVPLEEDEPSWPDQTGAHPADGSPLPVPLPPGVTWNSGTRQLTVAPTSALAGRLHFAVYAAKRGCVCVPMRFNVNVGPVINTPTLTMYNGVPYSRNLYADCDCGVLVSNSAGHRAKVMSVTGLPTGMTYNDTTGIMSGTPTVNGSYTIAITVTNSLGQQASKNVSASVSAPPTYAYESWTKKGWFDASDSSTITFLGTPSPATTGDVVGTLANKATGNGDLTASQGLPTGRIKVVTGAQNGRDIIRVTRDVSSQANIGFLAALSTDAISTMCAGNDLPYTLIVAYKPTDTNTGFIADWSRTVNSTNGEQIALVRRSGTAPSVRRQLVNATANDVSWGSGQASGTPRVVAIRHTGTDVTVWDNHSTKDVTATSQDVTTFGAVSFLLFAARSNGSGPTTQLVQCAMDFYEAVILDNATTSDADIQQCIADLQTKWGIAAT